MRRAALIASVLCVAATSGCTLMPESLQPHQLWKLNRQPASGRDDAFFSVSDPFLKTSSDDPAVTADAPSTSNGAETSWETDPF